MKPSGERPPRLGLKLALRALLACFLVMVLTATALATTVLREVDDILEPLRLPGRADIDVPELDIPDPGGPRTFMVLGSDKREGVDADSPPRSDTILLARADPGKDAITVMSIPRDLKLEIPGHGEGKINSAFELGGRKGGPRLVVRTVKKLFEDATGEKFPITNVMVMDYGAFRRAVNYIEGVYVDIDRDYFNDNSSGENYATIDIDPGYQKLRGRDALDYVRYRHTDNDLVRAARQQDFLRQAKEQVGVSKLFGDRKELLRIFARYTQTDIRGTEAILRLIKLAVESANHPVQEIRFPGEQGIEFVTTTAEKIDRAVARFLNAKASPGPRGRTKTTAAGKRAKRRHRRRRSSGVAGLVQARTAGEDQAIALATHLSFPVYFPKLLKAGGQYLVDDRRAYDIYDRNHHRYRAYRIVVSAGEVGQYYGIQGTTWKAAPILDNPSERRRMGGRTYELFFDGDRLRLIGWRTKKAVYWVSNTLLQTLNNRQMLAIARSLTRIGAR